MNQTTLVLQHLLIIDKKSILVLCEEPKQRLDGTAVTAEAKYSINFPEPKIFFLSPYNHGSNGFLYVNGVAIYQFKTTDSEMHMHCV